MTNFSTPHIRGFADWLDGEVAWNDMYTTIRPQALDEGCDPEGFTGLLSPLAGLVGETLRGFADDLVQVAMHKIYGIASGLRTCADQYDGIERTNDDILGTVDNHRSDYR